MKKYITIIIILSFFVFPPALFPEIFSRNYSGENGHRVSRISIKTVNGKFYAYVVLLFNENPHFVNLIQKGTISLKEIGNEGFNIKAYKHYLTTIYEKKLHQEASEILKIFLDPHSYTDEQLRNKEISLTRRNVILKFFRDKSSSGMPITLDYCIFGEKKNIQIRHPLYENKDNIFYIKKFIYYDEFSTSNSTFYYDMIYINPDEVENDYIIAKSIINNRDIKSMFFVGSRINDDIRYCLKKSFQNTGSIRQKIWEMFVIHELTHKITNNQYDNYDQITGEELSLSSTIYTNPYLGLSVLYSYLNYNKVNPHHVAAMNYVTYISNYMGKKEIMQNPGLIKLISSEKLREITKSHFKDCLKKIGE